MKDATSSAPRLLFVDALRGIAALAVTLYHFTVHYPAAPAAPHSASTFRDIFEAIALRGNGGVDIFFVISGFVIAYSLRNLKPTGRNAGVFLLRRSIRLDPPYLVTLFSALGCAFLSHLFLHDSLAALPRSWSHVLINMVYLQELMQIPAIVAVGWTLCIEIQFYLVFVLIWWLSQSVRAGNRLLLAGLVPLTLGWLIVRSRLSQDPFPGLFFEHWYLFQLGILACWALLGRIRSVWFGLYAAAVAGFLFVRWDIRTVLGLATAVSIFCVGKAGRLHDYFSWLPLQYLGRRSYSIYLVHTVIGSRVMNVMWRLTHGSPSFPTTLVFIGLALCATLLTAEMLYRWVEKPSVELAKRLKGRKEEAEATVALSPFREGWRRRSRSAA
jgi:peptidoglycan/LPS O-acetylase OafA/YrhL